MLEEFVFHRVAESPRAPSRSNQIVPRESTGDPLADFPHLRSVAEVDPMDARRPMSALDDGACALNVAVALNPYELALLVWYSFWYMSLPGSRLSEVGF